MEGGAPGRRELARILRRPDARLDVEPDTTGLAFTAAVALDTGAFELTGRVGYAPNLDWRETTKAERDNLWEEWTPAAMKGSGGTYEMEGSLQLTSVLSLVAGVEGIVQQSAKVASLAETYKNSAGDSEGTHRDRPAQSLSTTATPLSSVCGCGSDIWESTSRRPRPRSTHVGPGRGALFFRLCAAVNPRNSLLFETSLPSCRSAEP